MNPTDPVTWPETVAVGDGITLRAPDPIDAEAMVTAINASLEHLSRWMAWAAEPARLDHQAVRLAIAAEAFAAGGDVTYTILRGADVVGAVGLHTRLGPGAYEIGYWLRADAQGRGIMARAVAAAVSVAFDAGRAERLEIHCDEGNDRSAAVARRAGFALLRTIDDPDREPPSPTGRTMIWERRDLGKAGSGKGGIWERRDHRSEADLAVI